MNDYTPSDAAKAYSKDLCTISHPNHRSNCLYETSFDAGIAHERESRKPRTITTASELAAAGNVDLRTPLGNLISGNNHDGWEITGKERAMTTAEVAALAPLTLLVPATESAPEPERLTDADDKRIKPGARVRQVRDDMTVVDSQAPYGVDNIPLALLKDAVKAPYAGESWYLLAEAAPSPDAEIVSTLAAVLGADMSAALVPEVLDRIRSAGLDIVKREADQRPANDSKSHARIGGPL